MKGGKKMGAEAVKSDKKRQSPYWMGRHKRSFLGGLAVVSIAAAAGLSAIGVSRQEDTASRGAEALQRDRACLELVRERAPSGTGTATVSTDTLSRAQRLACRLDSLPSRVNVGDGYGSSRLPVTIVASKVELPSATDLQAAVAQDRSDSRADKYGQLPEDVLIGGLGVGLMVFFGTALASGDAFVWNRRVSAPPGDRSQITA